MKRILSIDDDPGVVDCLRQSLGERGYDTVTSTDPADGLRLFGQSQFDLVLLDVNMPGISGFEVYRQMRNVRKVPVLFVTAYPRAFNPAVDEVRRMWQEEFADGTTDIVYKPFRLNTLFDKVEALLGSAPSDDYE